MARHRTVRRTRRFQFKRFHFYCLLLAMGLTLLNHYAVYLPWLYDEGVMVKATWVKKKIQHFFHVDGHRHFIADNFLLIDISNDVAVYADTSHVDDMGMPVDAGSIKYAPSAAGTDLVKLTALFRWLAEHPEQYNLIVFDMQLQGLDSTAATAELLGYLVELSRMKNKIIFSAIYDPASKDFISSGLIKKIPEELKGAVNNEGAGGAFFKYQLSYKKGVIKTVPLLMYERLMHDTVKPSILSTYRYQGGLADNLFIPEIIFQCEDIDTMKHAGAKTGDPVDTTVSVIDLWQTVLRFDSTDGYYLRQALHTAQPRRNLFIGSFNHAHPDMHNTIYGDMDGAIILLNLYYNLINEENEFSVFYLLFTFCCFYGMAYFLVRHPHKPFHIRNRIVDSVLNQGWEQLQYVLFLLMTGVSSIGFNKATNVILLFLIVGGIDYCIKLWRSPS